MKQVLFGLALITIFTSSCGSSKSAVPGAEPYYQSYTPNEVITESLFNDKDATLTEESIQKLLDGSIVVPQNARIAVYRFGSGNRNRYYPSWNTNEDYLKTQQQYLDTLIDGMNESADIQKIILMPQMMTSGQPNITQLREAAVRLQADLLLVFQLNSDLYYKYKMFQKDEAKAFATCEAVLLDIRTGVIPHSSVFTEEFYAQKTDADLTVQEMQRRAENSAVMKVLTKTGIELSRFLQQ